MKTILSYSCFVFFLVFFSSCNYNSPAGKDQLSEARQLEQFLNIPIYPGAKMVMLITDDRDKEIPRNTKPATVSLAIDHRDSVPVFYERKLGYPFLVDTTGGKTYYKLVFDKEGWEYEIMVGQDVFENQAMFTISVNELPY